MSAVKPTMMNPTTTPMMNPTCPTMSCPTNMNMPMNMPMNMGPMSMPMNMGPMNMPMNMGPTNMPMHMGSMGAMGSHMNECAGMMPWGMTEYMPTHHTTGGNTWGNWMMPFGGFDRGFMHPFSGNNSNYFGNMWHNMTNWMNHMTRNFSNELTFMPSRPGSMMENYSLTNPIRYDTEGNRWLNCCFDMRSYKPEEINVTFNAKERCLCVEANHEVKDSKDHYIKRSYSRKYYIPESIKDDFSKVELKSCLTNEGLLCVEAQLPRMALTGTTTMTPGMTTGMTTGMTMTPVNVKVM